MVVLEPFGPGREVELVDPEGLRAELAAHEPDHASLGLDIVDVDGLVRHLCSFHIRKTPKVDSGIGAFSAAEIPSASTRLVSSGSMIPSSQSRAVEW